ncbi:MAG: hypothetical protein DRO15_05205 [Thermoprotei archaeon]|nr:MAG: hypothetical protein DRO15_05205 [Thermoprotei archaeon]
MGLKAVIPVAGLGTRMLPASKEQPKEMLPIFDKGVKNVIVKPFVQRVFEELYKAGFRDFYFIVGRGKRSIEDHFSVDEAFISQLLSKGKGALVEDLSSFYSMVLDSRITWINQHKPLGFGHAVLQVELAIGDSDTLLVHAGDTLVLDDEGREHPLIRELIKLHEELRPDALLIVKKVPNPQIYGVVTLGKNVKSHVYQVDNIVEKPKVPISNIASMAIYSFSKEIFNALKKTPFSAKGELELTDAIRLLINEGRKVLAFLVPEEYVRIDIGTPENYWEALKTTYRIALRMIRK